MVGCCCKKIINDHKENLCGTSVEATEVMDSNRSRTNGLMNLWIKLILCLMTLIKGSLSCNIKSGNE